MRRLFTFAIGVGLGATLALLIARGFRRARRRVPQAIADEARAWVGSFRETFSDALAEGRRAMEHREEELRQRAGQLEGRSVDTPKGFDRRAKLAVDRPM